MNTTKLAGNFLLPISLLIFSLTAFSCSADLEDKVVGNWQGYDFLFQKTEGPDIVVTINGGLEQHLRSKLILSDNGTFQKLVGEYDNGKGTWVVEEDKLITTNENGEKLIYTLLKVTDKELMTLHEVDLKTPDGTLKGKIILSYTR
ncbi:hypothetical protein [Algoriphagus winogradskyi]|uniref:Lipocalin-like domain-containing protein n=1 Tax=Algoriphagus winogradskyi TaxID=237017 RepID=A0ABY1PFK4_9BACT|nr:hypothetical protein [Algoriphagus winogradskyi]SMP33144.1 hypothetical protein SAMN06265367_108121 [Algoriphagus winogradskyi]